MLSTGDFMHTKSNNNPYIYEERPDINFRKQRKNLASANVFGRRDKAARGIISVTDSMSQPDFSMGVGAEA